MLRLALVAGLMSSAYGFATSGDVCMLYSFYDSNDSVPTAAAECKQESVGTTTGPVNTSVTNMVGARPIVLGNCYQTVGAALLPTNSMFGVASTKADAFTNTSATGVEFNNNAGDVEMTPYTGAYDAATLLDPTGGCTTPAMTAVTAVSHGDTATGTGWACRANGGSNSAGTSALGMGVALAVNSYSACEGGTTPVKYVTVKTKLSLGGTLPVWSSSTTYATTAAQNIDHWPVAPTEFFSKPLAGATTDLAMTAALCFPAAFTYAGGAAPTGSWQMVCDLETGNIDRTDDINNPACAWSGSVTSIFKRGSSNTTTLGASGILGNAQMSAITGGAYSNAMGFNIMNTSAEWDAVCAIPAHTAPAEYFNGYHVKTQSTCAAHKDSVGTTSLASTNSGTRSVIMDVCYTLNAAGQMLGWRGPFSAGAATTIPVASKRSVKFVKNAAVIEMWHYTEHDCSGTVSKTQTDNPAAGTGWGCANTSSISHGGDGAAGNATQLKTAVKYLTVRQHTDDTAAISDVVGKSGTCLGLANAGPSASGSHLDHFVVHTNDNGGPGVDPATGCHQVEASSTDALADGNSYAWWCDTTDYSINYAEFDDNKCKTQTAATQLKFTKLAYDDTDYETVSTLVNGAAANFGGKCLVKAVDISWEILTNNVTWDAICSAGADPADTDSAAGKIAATVAAGAAAAAALLI